MQQIKPIPFKLTPNSQTEARFKRYLEDKTRSLRQGLTQLHGNDGIIKWRKAYEAVPAEPVREFPWHNASNLVVPIVAIHSDTLLARLMSAVMKTRPFWVMRELGEFAKSAPAGLRDAVEEFLQYVAMEPEELDLCRVEEEWFGEIIRLGTGILKTPWIKEVEDHYGPAGDLSDGSGWSEIIKYEGPRPEKLRFENFKCPVNVNTLEAMDFKYDVIQMDRYKLEERAFRGIYDYVAVQRILEQPDRTSRVGQVEAQKQQDAKVKTTPGYGFAEWDICECHFKYRVDATHFARLIVWWHEKSKQIARSFYHYYPTDVYIAGRLFFRDDMFHGMGFGEILLPFQEEISEIHNQRRDNMTVANTKMWAVDPNSPLHKGFRMYPSAMLPAKQVNTQPEIMPLEFGTPVQGEIDSERLSLELAEKRSGVSPPMQGSGAGTNTKRGVYTAMGTLSLLQEGNTRTDLNISDVRYAHAKLGRIVGVQYGTFGVREELLERFGEKAPLIKAGLEALATGKMALPIYASTASVNREVEKQADLMLSGVLSKYNQEMTQLLNALANQMTPEPTRKYIAETIKSMRDFMKTVLRHFDRDEVDRMLPEPDTSGGQPPPQQPQGQQPQGPPQLGAGQPQQNGNGGVQPGMVPPSVLPQGRIM